MPTASLQITLEAIQRVSKIEELHCIILFSVQHYFTLCAYARNKVIGSVIGIVVHKNARSQDIVTWATRKHNEPVKLGKKN